MMELQTALETMENCRFCLMCRHVAPVGHVTHQEALTPHGVALTIASEKRGLIEWSPETVGIVYSEVDGGNSQAHCVTDQPFETAVSTIRADLVNRSLSPAAIYEMQTKLADNWSILGSDQPVMPNAKGDVALFVGDEAHYHRPQMVETAVTLLSKCGIQPVLIGAGIGNGFATSTVGLLESAKKQANAILEQLKASGATRLLVFSAGDYYAFTHLFAERLGIAWPTDVQVEEVLTVLANHELALTETAVGEPIAYIDPNHAIRISKRSKTPRTLLSQTIAVPLVELFWRADRAHPVGHSALYLTQPQIAETLTRARLEDAKATGAKTIICEDPATLFELEKYAGEYELFVHGLYEWLADHLK
jgi:Fe-S oxidoreductase